MQDDRAEDSMMPRAHGHGDMHHDFSNPEDWVAEWNSPERVAWQEPERVVAAMALSPGMTVADVGTGTGFFVPYLAEAVGAEGTVLAVDVEQGMIDFVAQSASEAGLTNVSTILATYDDARLEPASVDRILFVNTWHHIEHREAYGARLVAALRPGGTVTIVDFRMDAPEGPPLEMRLQPEQIVAELEAAGLQAEVVADLDLSRQYAVRAWVP